MTLALPSHSCPPSVFCARRSSTGATARRPRSEPVANPDAYAEKLTTEHAASPEDRALLPEGAEPPHNDSLTSVTAAAPAPERFRPARAEAAPCTARTSRGMPSTPEAGLREPLPEEGPPPCADVTGFPAPPRA